MRQHIFAFICVAIQAVNGLFLEELEKILLGLPLQATQSTTILPQDVVFYFYNRTEDFKGVQITEKNLNIIDKNKTTKIIIHGWFQSYQTPEYQKMTSEYLKKYDCQIFVVDWTKGMTESYRVTAENTKAVGKIVGQHIIEIGIALDKIHIIGHSFGAHVAGFCGKYINEVAGGKKIKRITGLDPARPLFEGSLSVNRLDKTDAIFVDVIHTSAGILGTLSATATVDFYPNGGTSIQPGCQTYILTSLNDVIRLITTALCSHNKSILLFTESINSQNFTARKCPSYLQYIYGFCNQNEMTTFGESVSLDVSGIYYLKTN